MADNRTSDYCAVSPLAIKCIWNRYLEWGGVMTSLRSKIKKISNITFTTDNMIVEQPLSEYQIDQIIQAITDLIDKAQPEKKEITKEMEAELGEDYPAYEHGHNNAIDEYKSNLLKGVRG